MSFFSSYNNPLFTSSESLCDVINLLPIGVLILENSESKLNNDYKISYSNSLAKKLLFINKDYDFNNFCINANKFKEFTIGNNINGITLYEFIFNKKVSGNKKFILNNNIIYVKLKYKNSKIYIVIDDYDEERQKIQKNYISNIGEQYLCTLYHEINNPLNSLLISISQIINNKMTEVKKRIEFLVFLLKMFLKTFILFFQISSLNKENLKTNTTINLDLLMKKISGKYSQLFEYKRIKFISNLNNLSKKCVNLDYYYFKNLLKNIYIYFYYHIKIGGVFYIESKEVFLNKNYFINLIFSKNKNSENLKRSYSTNDNTSIEFLKNNIQTENINIEIISKLANFLNIKIELSKKKDILLYIPYEEDYIFNSFCTFENEEEDEDVIDNINCLNKNNFKNNLKKSSKNEKLNSNKIIKKSSFNNTQIYKKKYKIELGKSKTYIEPDSNFEKIENNNNNQEIITEENYISSSDVSEREDNEIKSNEKKTLSTNMTLSQKDTISSRQFTLKCTLKEKNKSSGNLKINLENLYKEENQINNNINDKNNKNNILINDVLIVDDEQFNLNSLSNILNKLKIKCDTCQDGKNCIKLIEDQITKNNKCNYKLILMDIVMPIMNGLQTVEKIQEMCNENKINEKDINIIFISASFDQKENVNNLKKKCSIVKDFLVKPIKVSQIKNVINNFYLK